MKDLLSYYQEEIFALRTEAQRFANEFPEIAENLDLHGNISTDPHTERIIESFAFLGSRFRARLKLQSKEIPYYLLSALYPGALSVFPPCSLIELSQTTNARIELERGTRFYYSLPNGQDCIFKAIYPITLYPLKIDKVYLEKDKKYRIAIDFSSLSVPAEKMNITSLLFNIKADYIDKALELYAALFPINYKNKAYVRINNQVTEISPINIITAGYLDNETVMPLPKFVNYSFELIREILVFPQKFLFFKILNLDKIFKSIKNVDKFTILFDISENIEVNNDIINIATVPIVNLFEYTTDSFRFDGTKSRYTLKPSAELNSNIEIHSIQKLYMIKNNTEIEIPAFFRMANQETDLYWISIYDPEANFANISFVDTKMNPNKIYESIAYAKTLCINKLHERDIAIGQLLHNDKCVIAKIRMIPTGPEYVLKDNNELWALVTQLSFSRVNEEIKNNLKALIQLYSGKFKSQSLAMLKNIKEINISREYRRNFDLNAFAPELLFSVRLTKGQKSEYTHIFLKVLEQYIRNLLPINQMMKMRLE